MQKQKVVFILGPTGVGKTSMSVLLAKEFGGEIISADSVQVFKEFDIGSAKVTKEEMEGITHYGIDLVCPNEEFSASDYVGFTKAKIEDIASRGKLPIVVGGTALYVKSLVEGYNFGGTERHEEFRKDLEREIAENGLDNVFEQLKELNPEMASRIDGKNKVRVIRALEICKFGSGKEKNNLESDFDFKIFALTMPREKLYERINKRVEIMLENGLVEEVGKLYKKYGECQPMRAIGYKEVVPYLKDEVSLQEMQALISQHTRNYAKRQLTFLRGMNNVKFVDVLNGNEIDEMKEEIGLWLSR